MATRWLLASAQHHPSHGGIGAYVAHFVAAAVDAGWQVELITRPGQHHPPGAIVHEVNTLDTAAEFAERLPGLRHLERVRPYRYALWSLAVAKRLMTIGGRFNAIEFMDSQAEGYVALASHRVRNRWRSTPMIVHAHTPMFVEEQINGASAMRFGRHIYHAWEKQAIEMADGVMTASDLLRRSLPITRASAVIAYPLMNRPHASVNDWKFRNECIVLVGSVQPRKGVDIWARSLNQVLAMRSTFRAVLIGSDTPTAPDGTSMVKYVQSLVQPELRNRFQWRGSLPHDEVLKLISTSRLVVVPSRFDNSPFVVAEALGCGTPVVVSDHVGWLEHVPQLPAFPTNDASALAAAQLAILDDPLQASRHAERNRKRLIEVCAPAQHLQQRLAFVDSLNTGAFERVADLNRVDAMDEAEAFIASVEAAERSLLVPSSEVL